MIPFTDRAARPRRLLLVDGYELSDHCLEPGGAWDAWADRRPRKECRNNPIVIGSRR